MPKQNRDDRNESFISTGYKLGFSIGNSPNHNNPNYTPPEKLSQGYQQGYHDGLTIYKQDQLRRLIQRK